ncbi:MAG: MFS transporter [Nitrospinota bacterium]|nr:MFS transporter [Nitrospinota bacterium]
MNTSIYKDINLYIIFAITLGGIVSVSLVIPVIPVIGAEFSVTPAEVGLIISSYTLPGVLFILFLGVLADKIGRKPILVVSLTIFSVAGGAIYWLDDFYWIVAFRFIQGIGGAALPAISTVLVGDLFHEDLRLKVMGLNAAVLSVGTAAFPFIGGTLATVSWKAPFLMFWLGLPLALFVIVYLKEPEFQKRENFLEYFNHAKRYIFTFKSIFAFLVGLLIFVLLYGGVLTYLTFFMGNHFSMSPFSIGIYIASSSFASAIIAPLSSQIEKLIGRRAMLVLGFLFLATAFLLVLYIPSQVWLFLVMLLVGSCMGITLPLVQSIVAGLSPSEYRGLLVSFYGMTIRLGQTIGPPLLAVVLLFGDLREVFIACFLCSIGMALLLFVFGGIFIKHGFREY